MSVIKIIIDRRRTIEPVSTDRREDYEEVPIAWLVIKKKADGLS